MYYNLISQIFMKEFDQSEVVDMKNGKNIEIGLAIGLCIGTAIGAATDNIGLWLPVGMCLGLALGAAFGNDDSDDPGSDKEER